MCIIQKFNKFNEINFNKFLNFKVFDIHIGYIYKYLAEFIYLSFKQNFIIKDNNLILKNIDTVISYNNLTKFFVKIAFFLFNEKLINKITHEYFNVYCLESFKIIFKIDRSLLSFFGILAKGVHLNGYIKKNNKIYIWIAQRSKNKLLYPTKLDNITAGGISENYTVLDTLLKEALEEASIEKSIVKYATFATKLHYYYPARDGIRNDLMYIYNLELPLNFTPKKNDGEVERFLLLESDEVLSILKNTDDFKFNSAISIIHFLMEKKIINQSNTHIKIITAIKKKIDVMKSSRILKFL